LAENPKGNRLRDRRDKTQYNISNMMFQFFALISFAWAQLVVKGDLEGIACSDDELQRYRTIVCGEVIQNCQLEWCKNYIHEWKKDFGACNQLGCGAPEEAAGTA